MQNLKKHTKITLKLMKTAVFADKLHSLLIKLIFIAVGTYIMKNKLKSANGIFVFGEETAV